MNRVFIFGAGGFGREILNEIKSEKEVIGFLDNDVNRVGEIVDGFEILGNAEASKDMDYDEIVLGTMALSIIDQLLEVGVPRKKIITEYISVRINARINFLKDFAALNADNNRQYCVAEGGVFQGEFSKEINKAFPESKLYLFDTFEGFDERDTSVEKENGYSEVNVGHFGYTSEELVLSKMINPEQVTIVKGYFPESAENVDKNNKYIFVNLDFDLYKPILAGLEYFYEKMAPNGVILIHDYYHMNYKAVPKAISEFEKRIGKQLIKMPIGDHCSMAIIKMD